MRRTLLLGSVVVATAVPGSAAAFDETPCGQGELRCSHVTVPLDRTGAMPGTVALDVRRLPAAPAPTPTAFVVLLGGPGQVASTSAPELAMELGAFRGARDLILFDERGVGGSGALRCPGLLRPSGPGPLGCAERLGAARGHFTTAADVEDVEAIRAAGGYERLALYGASYGTKVALGYAAAHPDRVERMVLDSTVAPEGPDPLLLSTLAAMPRVARSICADGACRGVTSAPAGELSRLARLLARGVVSGRYVDPDGRAKRTLITPIALLTMLSAGDTDPVMRAALPAAAHAALHGDAAPLARLQAQLAGAGARARVMDGDGDGAAALARLAETASHARAADDGVNRARFVTTTCEETRFPWDRAATPATRAAQASAHVRAMPRERFAPFDRETVILGGLLPLCVEWPVASAPPAPVTLPAGTPTLLLAGGEDLRTPLEDAQAVAARLGPAAQIVVVPHAGHSVLGSDLSGCAGDAVTAFLAGAPIASCADVQRLVDPAPLPPRSRDAVAPYPGLHGAAGRTVAAASHTISDASRRRLSERLQGTGAHRFGGLRSGTATIEPGGLRLHDYVYVPGVAVSGIIPDDTMLPIELRIRARGASGHLRAGGGRVAGRLGGERFSVSIARAAASAWAPLRLADPALRVP